MTTSVNPLEETATDRAVEYAAVYRQRGWKPVRLAPGDKMPHDDGWPSLALADAIPAPGFAGHNVGLLLGDAGGGLVDVDIDCSEGLQLAPYFLPPTLTFGRASKPRSHWLYLSSGARTVRLDFGVSEDGEKGLIELRANRASDGASGLQTMAPGSTHPSGDLVEWTADDEATEPATISAGELRWIVARLTVACAILRDWREGSGRNAKSLGLTGGLLKAGWTADEVVQLFDAVREASGDDREKDRGAVERTIDAFAQGQDVTGFGALVEDGVLTEATAAVLRKHCRTPEQLRKDVTYALTASGAGIRSRLLAEAREVDGMTAAYAAVDRARKEEGAALAERSPQKSATAETASLGKPYSFTEPETPLAYLCEGLCLAKGGDGKISLLAGEAGGGKGPIADHLAICFALGAKAFGLWPCKQVNVLLLDSEGGRLTMRRLRRLARGMGHDPAELDGRLHVFGTAAEDMMSADYQNALATFVAGHKIEAIIQDSYTSAMLGKGLDANQPDFAVLAQMLGQLDVMVLGVAHANKAASVHGRQPRVSDVAYTQALGAMAQTVIVVHYPDPEDRHHIHVGCARSPEQDFKSFVVKFSDALGLGSPLKVAVVKADGDGPRTARERRHTETVQKRAATIERVLRGDGAVLSPMSVSKVRAAAGMNGDAFNEALLVCEARGAVSREYGGKLCFVPEQRRARMAVR